MALSTPYCTLQDLKDELRNDDSEIKPEVLTRHEEAINQASRLVEDWCLRDFTYHDHSSTPYTVLEREVIGDMIYLAWPIKTLTLVTVDGDTISVDDYRVSGGKGIKYAFEWPDFPFDNDSFIQLTGTFGYTHTTLTTIPEDPLFPIGVRRATTIIAATLTGDYRKEIPNREGGGITSLLVNDIPTQAKKMLNRYRRQFL